MTDMIDTTREKFTKFAKVFGVSTEMLSKHYRVFVPYNNQIPQVLVKSNKPSALEHKRLIVRITQWPLRSPFPFG